MENVIERFLRYVQIDTCSDEESNTHPSTLKQHDLAGMLVEELENMGAAEITYDREHCYVYATIPASQGCEDKPVVGFIAHMDTSPAMSGAGVRPRIVKNYDGQDIVLNQELGVVLRTADFLRFANTRDRISLSRMAPRCWGRMTKREWRRLWPWQSIFWLIPTSPTASCGLVSPRMRRSAQGRIF